MLGPKLEFGVYEGDEEIFLYKSLNWALYNFLWFQVVFG
jgi:hypothetical protein